PTCSGSTASAAAGAATVSATRATGARPRPESGGRAAAGGGRTGGAAALARAREEIVACLSARCSTFAEPTPGREHAVADPRRRLTGRSRQLECAGTGNGEQQVEPVEESTLELLAVLVDPIRAARALSCPIATGAARAEVHGTHELKPGRERRPA